MKIAIVGANGKVGTELCHWMKDDREVEIVPIVRNILGSAYLVELGLNTRIADICIQEQAEEALRDIDQVVICSYVFGPGPAAHKANRLMVDHAIRYSSSTAKIVYMSSVRALGARIDRGTSRLSIPKSYDRKKRFLEGYVVKQCTKANKKGIVLRLGHVYGDNQPRTKALKELLDNNECVELYVSAAKPSNVVHTVTIADCVRICAQAEISPGIYSLVNVPQWSWQTVFEYYNFKKSTLLFRSPIQRSFARRLWEMLWQKVFRYREHLAELRQFMPLRFERKLQRRFAVRNAGVQIQKLLEARKTPVIMREFQYRPMPEILVPGLRRTDQLLSGQSGGSGISSTI